MSASTMTNQDLADAIEWLALSTPFDRIRWAHDEIHTRHDAIIALGATAAVAAQKWLHVTRAPAGAHWHNDTDPTGCTAAEDARALICAQMNRDDEGTLLLLQAIADPATPRWTGRVGACFVHLVDGVRSAFEEVAP